MRMFHEREAELMKIIKGLRDRNTRLHELYNSAIAQNAKLIKVIRALRGIYDINGEGDYGK